MHALYSVIFEKEFFTGAAKTIFEEFTGTLWNKF